MVTGLLDFAKFEAGKIVVGHSLVDDVRYYYNGKVIAIDTHHATGDTEGLLIDHGAEYKVDLKGLKSSIN